MGAVVNTTTSGRASCSAVMMPCASLSSAMATTRARGALGKASRSVAASAVAEAAVCAPSRTSQGASSGLLHINRATCIQGSEVDNGPHPRFINYSVCCQGFNLTTHHHIPFAYTYPQAYSHAPPHTPIAHIHYYTPILCHERIVSRLRSTLSLSTPIQKNLPAICQITIFKP